MPPPTTSESAIDPNLTAIGTKSDDANRESSVMELCLFVERTWRSSTERGDFALFVLGDGVLAVAHRAWTEFSHG